ncbi:hypothetical protein GCM10025760_25880 [Microbacterium yannicii]|uniref:SseB protein N-terminal domain-containing protein n=1 Tax=Microbacterium yannicii TaxID=671622 RepID=A0ABP9MD38_9MICO|nr:SseB family protein [Microbacterium yannicii]MCO5952967.1 SseB family protein [Microbacterium yannicii]
MALFSRRPKKPAEPSEPSPVPEPAADERVEPDAADAAAMSSGPDVTASPETSTEPPASAAAETPAEPAAAAGEESGVGSVPISLSAFGGLGASPQSAASTPAASAGPQDPSSGDQPMPSGPRPRLGTREWMRTAPEQTETVPGLRDNVLLRAALGRVGDAPASQALLDVARQLLQGHVFLRVKGDARTLLAEGKGLPLAVANAGDRTFALVFSSGAALQASLKADGDTDTSAMGQPVLTVLRHVFESSYDGIIIDPASTPSRAVLPKELLQRAVDQADPQLTVKTLLAAERTPEIGAQVADALTRVPLWVAVGTAEGGAPGLAEGRDADGARYLEVYSHPLEVAVMGRGDNAAPITAAQLSRALRTDEGITGLVVDPAGPWIRLTRDELSPVISLAD